MSTDLRLLCLKKKLRIVIAEMLKAHPYEEAAYDIYPMEISGKGYSMGKVGELSEPLELISFIDTLKVQLKVKNIRLIGSREDKIKKVAVFCGSFDGDYVSVLREKADVLVTGDVKYHTALDMAEQALCVIDAGHYATESIMVPRLVELLSERFPCVGITGNSVESDPIIIA